jgi:phosphoenolpyruvate carboxylase
MSDVQEVIAASLAAARRLEQATREAREAYQDLRGIRDEIRQLLQTDVHGVVVGKINDAVKEGLQEYNEVLQRAMKQSTDSVEATLAARIERLWGWYMRGKRADGTPVHDVAVAYRILREHEEQQNAERIVGEDKP